MKLAITVAAVSLAAVAVAPAPAHAWSIGSQLNFAGCHEPITAEALRRVRALHDTAPPITPTRNEDAMIADVIFEPPEDFIHDLAGMALVIGVRDNDTKGNDPLNSLELQLVHGNPATQEEHCIRRHEDDGAAGDVNALEACRAYIRDTATAALDGLDASGTVDATVRMPLKFYTQVAGTITPPLPVFYVKMGMAMHAFEDGFTHVYRTADGKYVTTVLNWIDFAKTPYDEAQDGPPHLMQLDDCRNTQEPIIARNVALSTEAAAALLEVALDPERTREEKIAGFDAVTAKYLTYQPGCTKDNDWCDPDDAHVTANPTIPIGGCTAGGGVGVLGGALLAIGTLVIARRRRRRGVGGVGGTVAALGLAVTMMLAPGLAQADTLVTPEIGGVVATKTEAGDVSSWAVAAEVGASFERAGANGELGVRYRLSDRWLVGADVGWNPWFATSPPSAKAGVATYAATLIRRYPMKYAKVNLRTSMHLGASTLLFDVYGVPKYSTGPYAAVTPLGIDLDMGKRTRLIVDPIEFAIPVPRLGKIPLWYEQFRFMIGVQMGI